MQLDLGIIHTDTRSISIENKRWRFGKQLQTFFLNPFVVTLLLAAAAFLHPISSVLGLIFFIATATLALFSYPHELKKIFLTPWAILSGSLFLIIMLGSLYAQAPITKSITIAIKYLGLILLPVFVLIFKSNKNRQWAIHAFLLAMLFSFLCSLCMFYGYSVFWSPKKEFGAIFGNHIFVSYEMSFACFVSAIYAIRTRGLYRYFYTTLFILFSYHVLFMNSGRTGYITYGLFVLIYLAYFGKKLNFKYITIILVLLSIVIAQSSMFKDRISSLSNDFKTYKQENSVGYRIRFHHYAENIFLKNPIFGAGTGAFEYFFSHEQPEPNWGDKLNHPHGEYWHIAAEHGMVGLALFIAFLSALLYRVFYANSMKIIFFGLLVSYCLCFSFDAFLFKTTPQVLFILFVAIGLGESYAHENKHQ